MKRLPFLLLAALLAACSVFQGEPAETAYVIVDRSSNKAMSAYYVDSADRVVRTETYGDDAKVSRTRSFEYDDGGSVRAMVEAVPGRPTRTVGFSKDTVLDAQGRVERVVERSSEGEETVTFFGYDEAGVLRGTVMRSGASSVIMQDYDHD